jgi:fucose permease
VAAPAATISAIAFLVLIVATNQHWPVWTLFASALLAATMPSIPAMVRARWTGIFRDQPGLYTAFAFESVADELVYIAGASLSVGLSVALFPEAGMLASTLFLAVGTAAFLLQRSTEPRLEPSAERATGSAIRLRPVQIITLALIFVGVIFATAEVSTVAMTKELGQPGAASLVIGVYALGSFIVGIIVGGLNLTMPLPRRMLISVAAIALTTLPLLLADTVLMLAITVFISGLAISPTFITAFGLIERRVPEAMLTEGITWVMTGIGIGMALGAFAAGWVVDTFGAHSGFFVSVAAAFASLLTVLAGQKSLAGGRQEISGDTLAQPAE